MKKYFNFKFIFLLIFIYSIFFIFLGNILKKYSNEEKKRTYKFNFYNKLLNMKIALMQQNDLRKNFFISGKEKYLNLHLNYSNEVKKYINIIAKYPFSEKNKKKFDKLTYLRFQDEKYFNYIIANFCNCSPTQIYNFIDITMKNHNKIMSVTDDMLNHFEKDLQNDPAKRLSYKSLTSILILLFPLVIFISISLSFYFYYNKDKNLTILHNNFYRSLKDEKNYLEDLKFEAELKKFSDDLILFINRFNNIQKNLSESRNGNLNLIDEIKKIKKNYENEILTYSEELKIAQKKLSASERLASLGQLAAGVAHEIRNPLAGIQGAINIIGKKFVDEKGKPIIKDIIHEIERLDHIVESLLDFSSPVNLFLSEICLNDIIEKSLFLLDTTINSKNINIIINGDNDIKLFCDKDKIIQVLINILKNAIEVSDNNSDIIIEYKKIYEKYKPEILFIKIKDNGPGIDEEQLKYIFNPFYTSKPHGTGLGLSIVYNIIKEHNGNIHAESEKGKGCCFTINLPFLKKGDKNE